MTLITDKSDRLKEKWRRGEVSFGGALSLTDPTCAEILAQIGFDFVFIDMEHTVLDAHLLHGLFMGFHGTETVPIVRVVTHDPGPIKRILDLGAGGIIVPMVNNAAEARSVVAACKYPPQGIRGSGPRRASNYGHDNAAYWAAANESLITAIMIEHHNGADNIEKILEVEGIDAIAIGPGDLAASMGELGNTQHPDVEQLVERVVNACRRAGMPVMSGVAAGAGSVKGLLNQGLQILWLGIDFRWLRAGATNALAEAEKALRDHGG